MLLACARLSSRAGKTCSNHYLNGGSLNITHGPETSWEGSREEGSRGRASVFPRPPLPRGDGRCLSSGRHVSGTVLSDLRAHRYLSPTSPWRVGHLSKWETEAEGTSVSALPAKPRVVGGFAPGRPCCAVLPGPSSASHSILLEREHPVL